MSTRQKAIASLLLVPLLVVLQQVNADATDAIAAGASTRRALSQKIEAAQKACKQPNGTYTADCIKALHDDYNTLCDQVKILAAQTLPTSGGSLNLLASQQIQESQALQAFLVSNAVGLMNGTTVIPDKLLEATNGATPAPSAMEQGHVTTSRVMAGVEVASASSTDPSARFFADGSFDMPLAQAKVPINSRFWGWGYARLDSIAQPGPVSGITNVATYVQPLTSSTPEQLVQSGEVQLGLAYQFTKFNKKGKNGTVNPLRHSPLTFSGIVDGGFITPLSASQSTPAIYVASPAIQSYWSSQATADPGNSGAVKGACSNPDKSGQCYLAYLPASRSRFYRDWGAGLRVKKYYWNEENRKYDFPALLDLTFGQNEYVTGGSMRGFVMHVGWSTPIAHFQGVYLFGSADLVMASNQNGPNFSLQTAPSAVMINDPSVAQLFVQQPNRDRYRIGIGLDIITVLSKLHPSSDSSSKTGTSNQ